MLKYACFVLFVSLCLAKEGEYITRFYEVDYEESNNISDFISFKDNEYEDPVIFYKKSVTKLSPLLRASYTFKYKTNGHKHVKIDDIPNLCAEFEEETVTSNIAKMTLSMISNSTECKIGMDSEKILPDSYIFFWDEKLGVNCGPAVLDINIFDIQDQLQANPILHIGLKGDVVGEKC